jgi:2-polyprenyl-3-methyl-5-hydroxy-6-metoxy-1,4-benzoquinol methylase
MPLRVGGYRRIELASPLERLGRQCQRGWYEKVAQRIAPRDASVIDVGASDGYGVDILAAAGLKVRGIDPVPLRHDIDRMTANGAARCLGPVAYDYAVAMDVIEHVEDDWAFLGDLTRLAAIGVFFSTPNYNKSKCANEFHVREYTLQELTELLRWFRYEISMDDTESNFGVWIWSD